MVLTAWLSPGAAQDRTLNFESDDPEMNAAIRAAQDSLPIFFGSLDQAKDAAIKVAVPVVGDGPAHEHLWMAECGPSTTKDLACLIANEPEFVALKQGYPYHLTLDQITDWMFFDGAGRIHGAYTLRAMLPYLDEGEAAAYQTRLAPLPE